VAPIHLRLDLFHLVRDLSFDLLRLAHHLIFDLVDLL
jgi:hypothetical protein